MARNATQIYKMMRINPNMDPNTIATILSVVREPADDTGAGVVVEGAVLVVVVVVVVVGVVVVMGVKIVFVVVVVVMGVKIVVVVSTPVTYSQSSTRMIGK